ncbi:MAG: hypothetical protein ACYCSO_02300 [Cuniculiplasma sp.]
MTNVIVEHRWKTHNAEEVKKVVGNLVQMSRDKTLPPGFELKSVNILGSEPRAICNWDAPSVRDMKDFIEKINPPTKNEVSEAQRIV